MRQRDNNGFPLEINKDRGRKMFDIQRIFDWIANGLHWIGSILGILVISIVAILVWLSDLLFGDETSS